MDNEKIKKDIEIVGKLKGTYDMDTGKFYDALDSLLEFAIKAIPIEPPVKPACEMERPKLENFLPENTTTDMVNNMFLENNELYNYINALDHYIDYLESKSV